MSKKPTIQDLFDAGVHFGHQVKKWHPSMAKYIYTVKKDIHIIDLETTVDALDKACDFLGSIAKEGKNIVFVGTKKQAKELIEKEAIRSGAKYVNERWLGGTITNFDVIKKNINKYLRLVRDRETGEFSHYTKKERLLLDREIDKLHALIGGIVGLEGKPAALFVIDAKREKTAIREATASGIPVVALVDTNSDPRKVKYVVPGNDDAIMSISIILKAIADAVSDGYKAYEKSLEKSAPKEVQSDTKEEPTND